MNIDNTYHNEDLRTFMKKFDPKKFKITRAGVEIRGIKDMYRNLMHARTIISNLELNLTVVHTAEMLSYGGFQVNTI
ncbi:hypothetical protein [Pedobacter sp. Leaf176]|uniref:hypothetical protein n=1 Tax=Pedobacter sp. Leaf176 TaxID=1736286 RepID=UPI000701A344|nr:hypothetical protein [Pedobacter sp. Leaf176]KQR67468.1 hypothetical protein ASF92_17405 [Pedobacter sp. Leaf176]